ncbi:MAG TPA: hypothetical protein VKT22_13905 [Steroidobacteraceae bacterium]|nr:hypothetical protein [Steroidobacteraceae bacterium]
MRLLNVALLGTVLALGACHRNPAPGPKPQAAPKPHAPQSTDRKSPSAQTRDMVEAPSQGKSQAPVTLKFDLESRPIVGQPVLLALALLPQVSAGPLSVKVSATPGIELAAGDQQFELPTVDPDQVYRHEISLTPSEEGVQLVNLSVSIKHDEATDTRSFAIPIIVGAGAGPVQAPSSDEGAHPAAEGPRTGVSPKSPQAVR